MVVEIILGEVYLVDYEKVFMASHVVNVPVLSKDHWDWLQLRDRVFV
mgnify:CR=1 FL=1